MKEDIIDIFRLFLVVSSIAIALFLCGCGVGVRKVAIEEVHPSSVNTELTEVSKVRAVKLKPLEEVAEHISRPGEIQFYKVPILEDPAVAVREIEVDGTTNTIVIRTQVADIETTIPAPGETKHIRPGGEMIVEGVDGAPTVTTHETTIALEKSLGAEIRGVLRWIFMCAIAVGIIVVLIKVIPNWKWKARAEGL